MLIINNKKVTIAQFLIIHHQCYISSQNKTHHSTGIIKWKNRFLVDSGSGPSLAGPARSPTPAPSLAGGGSQDSHHTPRCFQMTLCDQADPNIHTLTLELQVGNVDWSMKGQQVVTCVAKAAKQPHFVFFQPFYCFVYSHPRGRASISSSFWFLCVKEFRDKLSEPTLKGK